jgi:hypothetical protein
MKPCFDDLTDVLSPVRDIYVASMLETMARELDRGAEVEPEPVDRDVSGRIQRHGPLDLPCRDDLRLGRHGSAATRSVDDAKMLGFDLVVARVGERTAARIAPFTWNRASVVVTGAKGAPDWTPLRRWFLEWFQARFGEESPDLLGVVHRLDGPADAARGWSFTVDLGSASPACFIAMLDALVASGCAEITVGETAEAA